VMRMNGTLAELMAKTDPKLSSSLGNSQNYSYELHFVL